MGGEGGKERVRKEEGEGKKRERNVGEGQREEKGEGKGNGNEKRMVCRCPLAAIRTSLTDLGASSGHFYQVIMIMILWQEREEAHAVCSHL